VAFFGLFVLVALVTFEYPVVALLFLGLNVGALRTQARLDPVRGRRLTVRYVWLAGLFVVAALVIPATERHWTASISGTGSGTVGVIGVRFERLNLSNALFQPALFVVLRALHPQARAGARIGYLCLALVLGAGAAWALTYGMP
jgi:hypothetical protein